MTEDPERAAAPSGEVPPDRIFVSNHVREMEIGVFPEEHGVTQRLRFDIVLEVASATPPDDDPEGIVSYDTLVQAVESLATGPRMKLVETLAERIADRCLADPRAHRVHVRIEKLDRLPAGGLGVAITRARSAKDASA